MRPKGHKSENAEMSPMGDKKKGPAEAATSPSHGSNQPHEGMEMNKTDDSTAGLRMAMASCYDLDDLDIDIIDLRGIIDAIYGIVHEMPFERDGARDEELDRVASLLRIARQFSAQIDANIQRIGPGSFGWRHDREIAQVAT